MNSAARAVAFVTALFVWFAAPREACAKAFVFEGYVETAPTNFVAPITHIMRLEAAGVIKLALIDTGERLRSRPLERQKIFGKLANDRTIEAVPVLRVEEVSPADWCQPQRDLSPLIAANWDGWGSSLYPSIRDEPLPEPGFTALIPALQIHLSPPVYQNGVLSFQVVGTPDRDCIVYGSSNLVTWEPLETNRLNSGTFNFEDLRAARIPLRFYRARLLDP
jgi:hypothetical protein